VGRNGLSRSAFPRLSLIRAHPHRRGALDDHALFKGQDAVHPARQFEIVRGDERREAGATHQLDERAHDILGGMDAPAESEYAE
jgi:hypothetical protein